MNIQQATNKDIKQVKELIFTVLREYGLAPDSNKTDMDLDNIESAYTQNSGYFGIIKEHNLIVATVGVFCIDKETCELRKMYAAPNQRGKGLGKKLLIHALEKGRQLGYKRMVLETASPLKEAIALYKKFGFVEYQAAHLAKRCDQSFELWF